MNLKQIPLGAKTCMSCIHNINTITGFTLFDKCKKFGKQIVERRIEYSVYKKTIVKRDYDLSIICRSDGMKCGIDGEFHTEK